MAFTHPSCPSSVCPSLGTLHKQSSGFVERTHQSRDPEGCTYQSSDPEGYTYQSSDPEGCTNQSSDLEGYTYQSSDPEGYTYQKGGSGRVCSENRFESGRRRTGAGDDWVFAVGRWSGMRSRQPARMHEMKRGSVGDSGLANGRMTDLKDCRRLVVRGRKTRMAAVGGVARRTATETKTKSETGTEAGRVLKRNGWRDERRCQLREGTKDEEEEGAGGGVSARALGFF
ncbi:NBS-LRR type resistance protein [Cucumis melo var. makuwa]|uniref:NBS-LRR type resistance protein n=1 Tax=Cucumis melo var. makuwa TaxID=1194695 RepID=A0A5D3E4K1_CUCMM|nr:NBS-LRR type resistance protein [Cucumis melo var. makuwa]